ncbi:Ribosome quality control complex subunit 2 [Trichoderma ghanense]|uniref:Ribosome quality control complex subunit 2 n=1 Tax=Trichoderma ghanense TaxID=65468 RepID=A0ABY2GYA0_9HYPO
MKQRFSSLDVKVIAHELQASLATLRLSNVYDLSSKILLLKFAKPDNKQQLLIDNGFRCHLTNFARTTAAAPSAFVARLRKYLKTRRLTSVAQVGTDRILEFQFSDGQYRLFLEFFASGNIILTDADLKILAISRNVSEGDGQEAQGVGLQYSLENRQNYGGIPPLTKERVKDALKAAAEKAEASTLASTFGKKAKGKSAGDLRKALAVSITELPPALVENVLQANNFDVSAKPADVVDNEPLLDALVNHLSEARDVVENIIASSTCKGYIFAKKRATSSSAPDDTDQAQKHEGLLYEDFHPFVPQKFKNDPSIQVLEFEGYNRTVDEFFSSLEGQKLESRLTGREEAAKKKLEAARQEQAKRIQGLQDAQAMNYRKAAAIEANVERVQEAMDAVNGLLDQGMDWVDIGKLIEREKKRQNPVAEIISLPLKLADNTITLLLAEEAFDEDEAEEDNPFETDDSDSEEDQGGSPPVKEKKSDKLLTVDIVLNMSPWSNAREYYEERRSAAMKQEKTQQQATKALKSTEQKIAEDLKKGLKQEKALLQPIRKQMWFEKFLWFISSDGYLVLGGKDPQQSEILYRRYLRKGDVYCHADIRGAANIVIKNNPNMPDAPIPPATLSQAGSLSVCTSEAWDSKAGMGAWWVNADQVSKTTPSGDILPAGNFTVQGKKNYLPPTQLLLGLGFVFKISEQSKGKHLKHRAHDERSSIAAEAATTGEEEVQNTEGLDDEEGSDAESEENQPGHDERANPLQSSGIEEEAADDAADKLSAAKISDQPSSDETTPSSGDAAGGDQGEGANEADAGKEEDDREEDKVAPSEPATEVSKAPNRASNTTSLATAASSAATQKRGQKRGQKGKAKKIAQKYKDQDEEDRATAEALIGATVGRQRAEAEAAAKAQRQAELEAMKERRRAQHERKQKEVAEQEELRRAMLNEGLDVQEPDEAEKATNLDTLVGTPLPGDEILEVIPVCAPWSALVRFKYKVKLQPGSVKKGKAIKEVLERLKTDSARKGVVDEAARDTEKMWPREVELIKSLKPEEIANCVPVSKLRVMMTGASGGSGGSGGGGGKGKGGGKSQGKGGKGGKGAKK